MMANSLWFAAGAAFMFMIVEQRPYSETAALAIGLPAIWGPMTRLISELHQDREYFGLQRRARLGGLHFEARNARLAREVLVEGRRKKKPASFWKRVYDWAFKGGR